VPIATVVRDHPLLLLAASAGAASCFAVFYLSTAFALSYATSTLGIDRQTFLALQLGANVFFAIGIIGAAIAADRFGAGRVMMLGAVLTVVTGLLFGPAMASGSLLAIFVLLSFALLVMGLSYGPLGGWMSALFPVRVRYTAISLAFTFGGIVGGALTPIAAQRLAAGGQIVAAGWLLTGVAALTIAGIRLARPAAE
jgi:MFS family permease